MDNVERFAEVGLVDQRPLVRLQVKRALDRPAPLALQREVGPPGEQPGHFAGVQAAREDLHRVDGEGGGSVARSQRAPQEQIPTRGRRRLPTLPAAQAELLLQAAVEIRLHAARGRVPGEEQVVPLVRLQMAPIQASYRRVHGCSPRVCHPNAEVGIALAFGKQDAEERALREHHRQRRRCVADQPRSAEAEGKGAGGLPELLGHRKYHRRTGGAGHHALPLCRGNEARARPESALKRLSADASSQGAVEAVFERLFGCAGQGGCQQKGRPERESNLQ